MLLDTFASLLYNKGMTIDTPRIRLRLAERREAAHLTQGELAKKVGIQTHSISNIERGKHDPSNETLTRICIALDCQPGDLLYIDTPPGN
jgi:putative transcriptional regulator